MELPKDFWFVVGEYLLPALGILQLAAYLEKVNNNAEIEVLDCQARNIDWRKLEKYIENFNPAIVATSGLATCNTYPILCTFEVAKKTKTEILTVVGRQH